MKNIALPPGPGDAERVGELIGRGESKSALDLAKQIHKSATSAASENLLIGAYLARIQAMADKQMWEEAEALVGLVRDKYPASRPRLQEFGARIALSRGRLDDLVRPLLDPDLPAEHKAAIEETIKRDVVDLQSLALCSALPADHSLRRGAAALAAAFTVVTSGPVEDEAIELSGISRRSPLASWKTLVRAIAAFHRRDDAACRRHLAVIEPGTIPARLVPTLGAICSGKPARDLTESAARLVDQIDGGSAAFSEAMALLEQSFLKDKQHNTLKLISPTVELCRRAAPDLVQQLRLRIALRAAIQDIPEKAMLAALGGAPRQDSEYYRLSAATFEKYGDPEFLSVVFDAWGEFRALAIQEGRFSANSPAEAVLFLHMAEILAAYPAELLEQGREMYEEVYTEHLLHLRKGALSPAELSPPALFARSCAIEPHAETFGAWLAWAKKQRGGSAAEEVAEAWHGALPDDVQPLLFLSTATQGRSAFQKALGWLAKAERLDALNPEVHRAKVRLLVVAAIRHLRLKKPHLIEEDIAALEALPLCREGDRPAFLEALRWCALHLRGNESAAATVRDRVVTQLGEIAAATILASLAQHGDLPAGVREDLLAAPGGKEGERPPAGDVARACALGAGMGLRIAIPRRWEKGLIKELSDRSGAQQLSSGPLYELAVTATYRDGRVPDLAYAATVAGIDGGGDFLPRFLLLRARLLPQWDEERRVHAIAASLELARRRRDLACIDEGIELKPTLSWAGRELLEDMGRNLSSEQVQTIIEQERRQRTFPTQRRPWPPSRRKRGSAFDAECDCPECRAERQRAETAVAKNAATAKKKEARERQKNLFEDEA